MRVEDFNFDLPKNLIAQDPLEVRSASRLLVLDKFSGAISHRQFTDIQNYLKKGDCLVINNTKVIPARLYGEKEGTQAQIEILLLKRQELNQKESLEKGESLKIEESLKKEESLKEEESLIKEESLRELEKSTRLWECLVKPEKKAKIGTKISFGNGLLIGKVIDITEEGNRLIQFEYKCIF
jgi:S-adenosylmethionine:tRNA ribosyltransferase-isomerase